MNKIIPCFDEESTRQHIRLVVNLANSNTGFFAGKRATFNNSPLLVDINDRHPYGEFVNIDMLLRRIYVNHVVNAGALEDLPTHVLVVSDKPEVDVMMSSVEDHAELVNEFESKDMPVPTFVYKNLNDSDVEEFITKLLGSSPVVAPVVAPVVEVAVEPVIDVVVEPVTESVEVAVEPVVETKKKK